MERIQGPRGIMRTPTHQKGAFLVVFTDFKMSNIDFYREFFHHLGALTIDHQVR